MTRRRPAIPKKLRHRLRFGPAAWLYTRYVLWLYVPIVLGLLIFCVLIFCIASVHVETSFQADLKTTAVRFTVGKWQNSDGLFNSDQPIDVTVQEASAIVSDSDHTRQCSVPKGNVLDPAETQFRLQHVQLDSIDMPEGTQVFLQVVEGALQMEVRRPMATSAPMATFIEEGESRLCGLDPVNLLAPGTDARWHVVSTTGDSLQLTLHFLPNTSLPTEPFIPIGPQGISFENSDGTSALTGKTNKLQLGRDTKPILLVHSRFEPTAVNNGRLHELTLQAATGDEGPRLTSLHLVLTGRSRSLNIISTYSDEAYNAANRLIDHVQKGISTTTLHLIYAALLGIVGLFYSVAGLLGSLSTLLTARLGIVDHRLNRLARERDHWLFSRDHPDAPVDEDY